MPSWTGQIADDCFPRAAFAVTRPPVVGARLAREACARLFVGRPPAPSKPLGRPQGGSTGGVHRFRGSAPQIKSGAGSAHEALSPVRSPAGRLPPSHWAAHRVGPTCNRKLPTEPAQGATPDCAPLWEPTLWATCPTKSASLRLIHLRALGTELRGLFGHAFGQRVGGIGHAFVGGVFAHVLGDLH